MAKQKKQKKARKLERPEILRLLKRNAIIGNFFVTAK